MFYTVCCVIVLAYHYVQIHVSSPTCHCLVAGEEEVSFKSDPKPDTKFDAKIESKVEPMFGVECQSLTEVKIMMSDACPMNTIEEEDEDLEALFRSACLSRQ